MIDKFEDIQEGNPMGVIPLKEEIILSALVMLGGSSRGAPIRKMVIGMTNKEIVYGTLYNLLENLIRKGYVTTRKSDPTPVPGGRSKTIYTISDEGRQALKETLHMHETIRKRLSDLEFGV